MIDDSHEKCYIGSGVRRKEDATAGSVGSPRFGRYETEVNSLVGATIVEARLSETSTPYHPLTVLTVQFPDGRRARVDVQQDPEGNGPGFLSIGSLFSPVPLHTIYHRPRRRSRCVDCGMVGETTGHQTCQYPGRSQGV